MDIETYIKLTMELLQQIGDFRYVKQIYSIVYHRWQKEAV